MRENTTLVAIWFLRGDTNENGVLDESDLTPIKKEIVGIEYINKNS